MIQTAGLLILRTPEAKQVFFSFFSNPSVSPSCFSPGAERGQDAARAWFLDQGRGGKEEFDVPRTR